MGLVEKLGETALDLSKDNNIQNKTVDLLGKLFPYFTLRQEALDLYVDDIKKSDLPTETKMICIFNANKVLKEMKNQHAIASIARNTAKDGTDFSDESDVDDEFFERYMHGAAFVSNKKMQLVWGKILANEFENPNSTPRNMIRVLSEITYRHAQAFKVLCSMKTLLICIDDQNRKFDHSWRIVVCFNDNFDFMMRNDISFEILTELDTLGLIKYDPVAGFVATGLDYQKVLVVTNGKVIETVCHNERGYPIGEVLFTEAGRTLQKITETTPIVGYEVAVENFLKNQNIEICNEATFRVIVNDDEIIVEDQVP